MSYRQDDDSGDDRLARVRDVMSHPEDVDLPEGLSSADEGASPGHDDPGHDGIDPGPPPPPADDEEAPPPEARCVGLPLNDFGNGQRLIVHFGADLIWIPRVGWFVWTGKVWRSDPDGIEVRRLAHQLSELIAREIHHMPLAREDEQVLSEAETAAAELEKLGVIPAKDRTDDQLSQMARAAKILAMAKDVKDRRDKSIGRRLTHAKNAGNSNALKNLMVEAATSIARPLDDLDADPLVINTLGGVLRFTMEPGEDDGGANPPRPAPRLQVEPHSREQLLSKIVPVDYDPKAACPQFLAFLERIQPAAEMRRFLQRWLGYSLSGLTSEQKFAFFYGAGANGKSVLVDLVAKIAGDYAASAKIESITGKNRRGGGDATPDLMPLIAARFVRTSEPDEGQRLQEGLIKELTGGEPILVRALNENFVLVYPIFKLTISGNHKPEIHGGDDGIWRRVLLVPFDIQIPPEERDADLGAKLWEERAGILNWLLAGLMDYLSGGLQVPDAVSAATADYREDSDPVGTFLTTCCDVTGSAEDRIPAKRLGEAINWWIDDAGRGTWHPQTIYKKLRAKAERWKSPRTGQMFRSRKASTAFYEGLRFTEEFGKRFNALHRDQAGKIIPGQHDPEDLR